MNEKDLLNINLNEEEKLNEEIDKSLVPLPLDETEKEIINQIIEAPTKDELQAQFDLFNLTQSKKNALRIVKLQSLLDKVEDQAIERFEKRPDQVSNRELLDYMQVVSSQIDRSQKSVDSLRDKPMIKAIQKNTEVNINVGTNVLDRESKERVMDAIQGLLKQINKASTQNSYTEAIPTIPVISAEVLDTNSDFEYNKNLNVLYSDEESFEESFIDNTSDDSDE